MCHCMKCNANVLVDSASVVQPCPSCKQYNCPHCKDHTIPCVWYTPVKENVLREIMFQANSGSGQLLKG